MDTELFEKRIETKESVEDFLLLVLSGQQEERERKEEKENQTGITGDVNGIE